MDEISQRPGRDTRPPRRWLVEAVITGLIAATAALTMSQAGHRAASLPGTRTATATRDATGAPDRQPPGAPGTALVSCNAALWWNLDSSWQADSMRVGPLWLVGARSLGYVRVGPSAGAARGAAGKAPPGHVWSMVVHVDSGSPAVMLVAARSRPYFQFINGDATGEYQPGEGVTGLTFGSCPRSGTASRWTDMYQLAFYLAPGHSAAVEVWAPASARPVWLTFSQPS